MQVPCPNPQCRKPITLDGANGTSKCPSCGTAYRPPAPAVKRPGEEMPASIGKYKISRELGRGAFGIVYQGLDESLDREVAIKVLNETALGSAKVVERFMREAKVMANMRHTHIVPVFELGKHGACPFIVSLCIKGRELAEAIPDGGMPPAQAITYVVQLLDALTCAHDLGVVHRDIKPSNILLDASDNVFVTDFGLAGMVGQHEMTRAGSRMGTPNYMPPEQCEGVLDLIGPASDQYSAGIVLYELLTSRTPFEGGGSLPAMLYAVVNTAPEPPSAYRAGLDPRLDALCMRAMAKKPSDRFPSCRAFAEALKAWKESPRAAPPVLPVPPIAPTKLTTAPDRKPKAERPSPPPAPMPPQERPRQRPDPIDEPETASGGSRHTMLIVASALAGVVVLVVAGILLYQMMGTEKPSKRGMRDLMKESGKK